MNLVLQQSLKKLDLIPKTLFVNMYETTDATNIGAKDAK